MDKELNLGTQISKYYKSFSGTDTLCFIMMPGSSPIVIGSLTTMSYSMFRNKKPVINIGRTNINGVTRGSRIFAGTMIFTLINQHWLKELQTQLPWLARFKELKVDELPLFDIMIVSANEYGNYVSMYIYGIDFTDEAQTISVEDLFTENTFSFIARDISTFKAGGTKSTIVQNSSVNQKYDEHSQRFYVLDSSNITLDELSKLEQELLRSKIESNAISKRYTLTRELYYSSSRILIGNDVTEIQNLLNKTKLFDIESNGIFDIIMDEVIRKYQSLIGSNINGIVDDKLYNDLINQTIEDGSRTGVIVNKYGAYVYRNTRLGSDIVDTRTYHEQVLLHDVVISDEGGRSQKWYRINTGYVVEEDIYSSYYTGGVIEFPKIKYGDNSVYVTMIQSALAIIDKSFTCVTGVYDYTTQDRIKQLQSDNGMYPSGIVDYDTWLLLQSLSGSITNQVSNDNFKFTFNLAPGIYDMNKSNIFSDINLFDIVVSCDNYINIKISCVCIYDDNKTETLSKTLTVREHRVITLKDIQNAFMYNPKYGKIPKEIDYIVYPYNKKPYKWTIKYS